MPGFPTAWKWPSHIARSSCSVMQWHPAVTELIYRGTLSLILVLSGSSTQKISRIVGIRQRPSPGTRNARHWPQSLGYLHRNLDPPILLLPVSSTEALPWSGHPKHLVSDSARKKQKTSFPPLLNFLDAFREPWGRQSSQHTKSFGGEWWTQGWLCKRDALAPGT